MDQLFRKIPGVLIYLDDLLIASNDVMEHWSTVRRVLQVCSDNGLVLSVDKCRFGQSEVEFLGHKVSRAGILPMTSKFDAMNWIDQECKKDLQHMLGLLNFY